jgi:LacI family gluconate utilization system Gnt-I transcriptional repressor
VHLNDSGRNGSGDRPVRVEDVAREAGVSPITVSRALRTPLKLRRETLERVMAAVARTGYIVNTIASSLRSGQSAVITMFVASLENPHFASAVQGALDAFEGSRFHLMFAQTGYSEALGAEVVDMLMPFRPAAAIFTGVVLGDEARNALRRLGVPVMEIWGDSDRAIDMAAGASIKAGARMMGEHFAERGYRHVAYCGHTQLPGGVGLTGFREGLRSAGLDVEYVLALEGTGTLARGMQALRDILADFPDCDAVFFGSDLLAVGALISAWDQNVDVPERVAIAGYGDLDFAAYMRPSLTTVRVSDYETGRLSGATLRRRLEVGATGDRIIQVPMELLVRDSTPRR